MYVEEEQVGSLVYEDGTVHYSFTGLACYGKEVTVRAGPDSEHSLCVGEVEVWGAVPSKFNLCLLGAILYGVVGEVHDCCHSHAQAVISFHQ